MTEDLEAILVTAFSPPPIVVRHVALVLACATCGRVASADFPCLGLPAEARAIGTALAGKRCACGVRWAGSADFVAKAGPVDPAVRGFGYCNGCRQLARTADMVPRPPWGAHCGLCRRLEEVRALVRDTPDDGWA